MSSGASGSDEKISGSKIQPLDSDTKTNVPLDQSSRGAVGTDRNIDQARIDPIGGAGQYQHTAPHTSTQGSTGLDSTIAGSKISPLDSNADIPTNKSEGLDEEIIDASRIAPVAGVREGL